MTTIVQILGPSGAVHYTRPVTDPMIGEALKTPGYAVRWPGIFNTGALDELPRECRGILTAPPEGLTLACPQTEKVPNYVLDDK